MGRILWCAQPVISRRCPIYDTSDREVVPIAERCGRGAVVYTALLITPAGGDVQEISVFTQSAINAILRDPSVDCLTSSDGGVIDFWFRSAVPGRYRPNRQATGLFAVGHHLLGAHGAVVVRQCHRVFEKAARADPLGG